MLALKSYKPCNLYLFFKAAVHSVKTYPHLDRLAKGFFCCGLGTVTITKTIFAASVLSPVFISAAMIQSFALIAFGLILIERTLMISWHKEGKIFKFIANNCLKENRVTRMVELIARFPFREAALCALSLNACLRLISSASIAPLTLLVGLASYTTVYLLGVKILFSSIPKEAYRSIAENSLKENLTANLADEIALSILRYIPPEEMIKNLALVCKEWNRLASDDTLWKFYIHAYSERLPLADKSFKQEYFSLKSLPFLPHINNEHLKTSWTLSSYLVNRYALPPDEKNIVYRKVNSINQLMFQTTDGTKWSYPSPIAIDELKYSSDGKKIIAHGILFSETIERKTVIWDSKGSILQSFDLKKRGCRGLKWQVISPNGNMSLVWDPKNLDPDSVYSIYDISTKKKIEFDNRDLGIQPFDNDDESDEDGTEDFLLSVAFSYDETKISFGISQEDDFSIDVWDLKSKRRLKDYFIPNINLRCLAFSHSGDKIAGCGFIEDGNKYMFYLFDLKSGTFLNYEDEDMYWVEQSPLVPLSIEFLPGDEWAIISYGSASLIPNAASRYDHHKLWHIESGKAIHPFTGYFTASWKAMFRYRPSEKDLTKYEIVVYRP